MVDTKHPGEKLNQYQEIDLFVELCDTTLIGVVFFTLRNKSYVLNSGL